MEKQYKSDPNLEVEPAYYSNGVPVFEPTMAQFKDFYQFNKAINKYGMQSGIAKVIPPAEWTELLRGTYTKENLESVKIKNPIVQNMNVTAGYQGVYSLQNVERQRSYNIFQWKELSQRPSYMPPTHKKSRGRGSHSPPSEAPEPEKDHVTRSVTKNATANALLDEDFNIDVSEYTPERCEQLEQMYWKTLGYAEPMYGADMLGSLFLNRTRIWNVAQLPNLLDLMEEKLPGVNDAYLYAGLWKATFSWHLEDQDLYSINYLHFGAPKQWYSIPQSQNSKFYNLMKEIFNEDFKNCPEFLRHKTFLASPQFLAKHGIKCNSIVHNQGEYMITYPFGYHAGFNYGYNLAESVNFALDDWFEFAKKTQKCECISDSVGINFRQIYCKFKGITYIPLDESRQASSLEKLLSPSASVLVTRKAGKKKQKVQITVQECALCPNNLSPLLTQYSQFELLDTDKADPRTLDPLRVHRLCANMFPKQLTIKRLARKEIVEGVDEISKAQRNLKCLVCHIPNRILMSLKVASNGACLQCSLGKCTRSYHATCALAAGFLFNSTNCKMHRASKSPFYPIGSEEAHATLKKMPKDSMIQFTFTRGSGKRHSGDVFCGVVTKNNIDEGTMEVLVYPGMSETMEVHYSDVLFNSAEDNLQFAGMAVSERAKGPVKSRTPVKSEKPVAVRTLARKRKSEPSKVERQEPIARLIPPIHALAQGPPQFAPMPVAYPPVPVAYPPMMPMMHNPMMGMNSLNRPMAHPLPQMTIAPRTELPPSFGYTPPSFVFSEGNYRFDMGKPISKPPHPNGLVFINEYSGGASRTPESAHRLRFVEQTFNDL